MCCDVAAVWVTEAGREQMRGETQSDGPLVIATREDQVLTTRSIITIMINYNMLIKRH